jgi:adenylate cyclase
VPSFRRKKQRTVHDVLVELGMSPEAIEEAEAAGTDQLLAIDGLVLPEKGRYTIDELAAKVGAEVAVIRAFWRGLGFVDPDAEERAFNKRDVTTLKALVDLTDDGRIDPGLSLQVARVIGVSMAQVATAVVDASFARSEERRSAESTDDEDHTIDDGLQAVRAGELLPFISDVLDYSFRRHLRAATRRRVAVASAADGAGQVIGFADLVRFTELSLQVPAEELTQVVGRFDQMVHEIVIRHEGRIVKMIGDAAMFTVVDPVHGALIAIELSEAAADDDQLPGLRVGMASGPVLARDGDLYGPVVNLASRLGTIGRAGAVNVSQEVRNSIAGDPRFNLRSLGTRALRHIGDVRVYRLRPSAAWAAHPVTRAGESIGESSESI